MVEKEREASPQLDIDIDLEGKNWVPSPIPAVEYEVNESPNEIPKGRNYIKDF